MEYIEAAENADLEIASEFLVMASELMLIKSRMLLPKEENEEDPRAALVEAMLEYKRAKEAAAKMEPLFAEYSLRMVKETDEITVDKTYVADHESILLRIAFERALKEAPVNDEKAKEKFEPIVSVKRVSVVEAASSLLSSFKKKKKVYLDDYFVSSTRSELIAKFMAILEMLNGVVKASSHISVTLKKNANKEEISALFGEEE